MYYITDAVKNNDLTTVKKMIKNKEQVYLHDIVMSKAARFGLIGIIQYLESQGFSVCDPNDNEPLRYAVKYGHIDTVKYLISRGANVHAKNDCVVCWAAQGGNLDIIKYLVDMGVDVNAQGGLALYSAAEYGNLGFIKYLVEEHGADVNIMNGVPLQQSAKKGHIKTVEYLINQGANPQNQLAIFWAISNGHHNVLKYLIKHGADIHSPNSEFLDRSFFYAITGGHLDMLKYLVTQGINICEKVENPLSCAIGSNRLDVVKFVMEQTTFTPVQKNKVLCKIKQNCSIACFLVEQGANISVIKDTRFKKKFESYLKLKPTMDDCIQQIHFDPKLERTKTEQIEEFQKFKKLKNLY